MSVRCPTCGQETPAGFPRCANCGAALATRPEAAREERKVVTVLFCDLVGFTGRAESMDPEDVRALLSGYHERVRRELERYGGTVEKFVGDAVMALFGAPQAHEDDPERAVRAALAIRDRAREEGDLRVRVGITTGEALVAVGARPEAGEAMASGDVVNTAARLQAAASENGILVDEVTHRATDGPIVYAARLAIEAKGKGEPVTVHEAVEARSRLGVDIEQRPATPLFGRERERELLVGALARARDEREPQLVTVVGVPGIGKSRLLFELSRAVDDDEELIVWRQGRSLPYGEGVSLWALAEIVKAQAGILDGDEEAVAEAKLAAAVLEMIEDRADAAWIQTRLRPLIGLADAEELGVDRRVEGFSAWRRFLEAIAEQGPTVLVFEDLHWADDELLDFVDYLVEWAGEVPLLVVCSSRPELLERRPAWGGGKPNTVTIRLSPLSDEDTARMAAALLERPVLEVETQTALLARAGGNPLYTEQFTHMLAEAGHLGEVPETLQGVIAARLDSLPVEEKALLQSAAVVGKIFWLGAVAALAGGSRDLEERFHALERKEFVRRERRSSVYGEHELAFRHALLRDVAYGQIPRAARADKHRLAAEWIESLGRPEDHAAMVAHHYLAALELTRAAGRPEAALAEQAAPALRAAGDRALALSAFPAAARFYEAALELWAPGDPERGELILRYAQSREDQVDFDLDLLEEGIAILLDLGRRERAAEGEALFAFQWWHRGNRGRAVEHLDRAVALVADAPSSRAKAYVLTQRSRFAMLAGDAERAIEIGLVGLEQAEELGLGDLESRNLNNLGTARFHLGDVKQGFADLDRAVAVGAEANSREEWNAALNRWWMLAMVGDLGRAWELHLETAAGTEQLGFVAGARWERAEHVVLEYWRGNWDDALRGAAAFLVEVEGLSHYMESQCRAACGRIALARGDLAGARAETGRALELARAIQDPQVIHPILPIHARVLVAAGDRDGANVLMKELLVALQDRTHLSEAPSEAAWLLSELGGGEELVEVLAAVPFESRWFRAAKLVLGGDLVAAAEEYAAIGTRPDEAHARLRSGHHDQIGRALAFYRTVGATRYVREGEALLAASA